MHVGVEQLEPTGLGTAQTVIPLAFPNSVKGVKMFPTLLFMILSTPFASAVGYHPHVLNNQGQCIAAPGSYNALWCTGHPEAPTPKGIVIHPWRKYVR